MDCGNKAVTIETNSKMLGFLKEDNQEVLISNSINQFNTTILEPCFIGENVVLKDCIIGPYVSIGNNCNLENTSVKNSLIQNNTKIINAKLDQAMIGNNVHFDGEFKSISIGDYSVLE